MKAKKTAAGKTCITCGVATGIFNYCKEHYHALSDDEKYQAVGELQKQTGASNAIDLKLD